jgi:hydroxymethylbilane synthase
MTHQPKSPIRIATRQSTLALWQARYVQGLLAAQGHSSELVTMTTAGDRIQDRFLHEIGGKGLFVKELENALAEGRADIAVHSLKDMPARLPEGFRLAAVLKRHSPNDQLILHPKHKGELSSIEADPLAWLARKGATVATASLRRSMLLHHLAPGCRTVGLRGNVDTRIRKLQESADWDAIILASASLERLDLFSQVLSVKLCEETFVPSPAQGALAIEVHDSSPAASAVEELSDASTMDEVSLERAVLARLGGDCTMPCSVYARSCFNKGHHIVHAVVLSQTFRCQARLEVAESWNASMIPAIVEKIMEVLSRDGLEHVMKELNLPMPKRG